MNIVDEVSIILKGYAIELGLKIVAPFYFLSDGKEIKCAAFLPDFGSAKGMIVGVTSGPSYDLDGDIVYFAKKNGLYLSFLSADFCLEAGIEDFKMAFQDWGFLGLERDRPIWLPKTAPGSHTPV